jgi:hypothetical protein
VNLLQEFNVCVCASALHTCARTRACMRVCSSVYVCMYALYVVCLHACVVVCSTCLKK